MVFEAFDLMFSFIYLFVAIIVILPLKIHVISLAPNPCISVYGVQYRLQLKARTF